jgi:UPF0042 nucleotide-binding protein
MRFIIITGMSGAGKSQTVKCLEDFGFFCVDNLPPALIPKFAEICFKSAGKMEKVALVIDIREGELLNDLLPYLSSLKGTEVSFEILFLEATNQVLVKRFKETRRLHPLSPGGSLIKGIEEERMILQDIKNKSNHIIDTSNLKPLDLKEELSSIFVEGKSFKGIIIQIVSFGFKYGNPIDSDLVFDVRFIPNPYYVESMKRLTGKDEPVKQYILKFSETTEFINKLSDMVEFLIPYYVREGKSQLVIGIGCTGGRHRSVAISESLYEILHTKQNRVVIDHRDIEKDNRSNSI